MTRPTQILCPQNSADFHRIGTYIILKVLNIFRSFHVHLLCMANLIMLLATKNYASVFLSFKHVQCKCIVAALWFSTWPAGDSMVLCFLYTQTWVVQMLGSSDLALLSLFLSFFTNLSFVVFIGIFCHLLWLKATAQLWEMLPIRLMATVNWQRVFTDTLVCVDKTFVPFVSWDNIYIMISFLFFLFFFLKQIYYGKVKNAPGYRV